MFSTPGPNGNPNPARRPGCRCGCGDDDDFWKDDFGGHLDGIFGPISQANFTRFRDTSPCQAYPVYISRGRFDDEDEETKDSGLFGSTDEEDEEEEALDVTE